MNHGFDAYLPVTATILENRIETDDIFTLIIQIENTGNSAFVNFLPGQFNMLYLFGIGEVAISIMHGVVLGNSIVFEHTIQIVGRITLGLSKLKTGDTIGLRGPFGSYWPLTAGQNKDIVIITGGLGNAPLVYAMNTIVNNRSSYNKVYVIQGVKDSNGLIYRDKYDSWNALPNTKVEIAASSGEFFGPWQWHRGFVTAAIPNLQIDVLNTVIMTVGPEIMMKKVAKEFIKCGVNKDNIYLSLERNMKCAIGHCGHCQLSDQFICKDGPVYSYSNICRYLDIPGL